MTLGKEKYLILLAQLQNHLCLVALSRWGVDDMSLLLIVLLLLMTGRQRGGKKIDETNSSEINANDSANTD